MRLLSAPNIPSRGRAMIYNETNAARLRVFGTSRGTSEYVGEPSPHMAAQTMLKIVTRHSLSPARGVAFDHTAAITALSVSQRGTLCICSLSPLTYM